MKRFFDKFVKRMADKYDPSIGGAIGLVSVMIGGGALLAAPVAGVVGGLIAGGAGAAWGAGLVLGAASFVIGRAVIPHYIHSKCYEHTVRNKVANGGDTHGSKWFPGIENLRRNSLSDRKQMMGKAFSKEAPKKPDNSKKENQPKNTPKQPKP